MNRRATARAFKGLHGVSWSDFSARRSGRSWRDGYWPESQQTRNGFRPGPGQAGPPITGYGILVVEDSDLAFFQTGQFLWNGIVLLTGRNNSSAFLGASNTEIRGALITNETNAAEVSGFSEFSVKTDGTMRIRASKENVDRALMALYSMRISAYREN